MSISQENKETSAEVDDEVEEEERVWDGVEDDPARAQVVVEEGDGDWEDDEVDDQQDQHEQVPVEPTG